MAEDRLEVTHLMGKKLDKPIILEWGPKPEDKNKMAEVAKLFGKKLGEEFKIKYGVGLDYEAVVKFTEKNFRVYHLSYWGWDNNLLAELLTGKAVIVDE